jgi:hypothetical protein
MNDLDSNGLLDMDEVRRLLQNELVDSRNDTGQEMDGRERAEEMERMRDHIYGEVDKNKDLMIDYSEFLVGLEESRKLDDSEKNWDTIDNEAHFNETEFNAYEKKRIDDIRADIGEGKKPDGYEFDDVPLLNNNFLNETHIQHNGELFLADDTPVEVRKAAVKEFYLKMKFELEQELAHIQDPDTREAVKVRRY